MRDKQKKGMVFMLTVALLLGQAIPATAAETPSPATAQTGDVVASAPAALPTDGVYRPDEFTTTGGTGKVKITCPQVTLQDGEITAKIVFSSPYYTQLQAGGQTYEGEIDETARTSTYEIPVVVNTDMEILATTTAMSEAHEIAYNLHITLSAASVQIEDSDPATEPGENPAEKPGADKPQGPDDKPETKKLADGTYRINAKTDERMFYLLTDEKDRPYVTLKKKGTHLQVTITLTGTGYDYLYLGAKADAEKATAKEKIKYKKKNGYYTYTFAIPALDEALAIAAHSAKRDAWYQHEIVFYRSGASKVEGDVTNVPEEKKEDSSKPTQKNDPNAGTAAISSQTTLKDGVYTPDQFSWSGGSGRLAYIRCSKITVKNGKATATIVFSSDSYDQVRAGGSIYQNMNSGGLSTFTIPVTLNANNTFAGRTTAMSQTHWISYTIYPYLAAADQTGGGKGEKVSKTALSTDAPKIAGKKAIPTAQPKYAENFRLYAYEGGIKLLQIKMDMVATGDDDKDAAAVTTDEDGVEYDEDGQPIAKSQGEITAALYHEPVVNYLLLPADTEVPAGLEKEMVIVRVPVKKSYVAAEKGAQWLTALKRTGQVAVTGATGEGPDYSVLIQQKCDLAILPTGDGNLAVETRESLKKMVRLLHDEQIISCSFPSFTEDWMTEAVTALTGEDPTAQETAFKRLATLGIPAIVDRAAAEPDPRGAAEWLRVYGALYDCEAQAEKLIEKEGKADEK